MMEMKCAPAGRAILAGPEISLTSCPATSAASAIAYPILPDERLLMKRTGSIASRVGPAVTTNLTRSDYPGGREGIPPEKRCRPLSTGGRRLRNRTPAFLLRGL